MDEFDYVIVGAGTAGSVLAHRLSENPDTRVLVLEAGSDWIPSNVDTAPLWFTLLGSDVDWNYQSVPQPGLGGRATHEPRGRMPGGSSNLYIMMHVRGHPSDFDNWAYQGAAGWSYRDLLPYFEKLETRQDVTDAGRHNPNPLSRTFIDVRNGVRQGALASYLEPAIGRPNLEVRSDAQVMRLVFEGDRCVGVEYRQQATDRPDGPGRAVGTTGGEPGAHTVRAGAEVIVCAGAIESPRLLMLSGIGPADQLRQHGIELVSALPGVGENFHNHVLTGLIAETVEPVAMGTQNLSESALFLASEPGLPAPDLQIAFVHVPFDIIVGQQHPNAVSILPGVVRPNSRGTVRLASADPFAAPLVDPNYLGDESDLRRMVQAVKLSREIFGTAAFSSLLKGELLPGSEVRTDAEIARFVRDRADSYHHQAGSCRMGVDDRSVVDPSLRVHGVSGLRVVDASVMPAVPSGNCHTAVVAIAERAADLVKGAL
jgi:choline dehydrogenase